MKNPIALVAACLIIGACTAAAGDPSGTPSPSAAVDLVGREYLSTRATENGADRSLVPGTRVRLSFGPRSLTASAGCNSISAGYVVAGDRLLTDQPGMTEMGCSADLHAQDEWLIALFGSRPQIRLDGQQLVIDNGSSTLTLVERAVADPDRPLAGTEWVLSSIIDGETVSSVPQGAGATISFAGDGTFAIAPGCNTGSGRYEVDDEMISFGDIALTKMACQGAGGTLEAAILAVLAAKRVGYEIRADSLTLTAGGRGLQFSAR